MGRVLNWVGRSHLVNRIIGKVQSLHSRLHAPRDFHWVLTSSPSSRKPRRMARRPAQTGLGAILGGEVARGCVSFCVSLFFGRERCCALLCEVLRR